MNHDGNAECFCQIHKLLMQRTQVAAVEFQTDDRTALRAEVFPHHDEIHPSTRGFKRPAERFELKINPTPGQKQPCGIIGDQVHQGLLHPSQHPVHINDIGETGRANVETKRIKPPTLAINMTVIVVVRRWHRPGRDFLLSGGLQWKITVIPVAATGVLDPDPVNAPVIHRDTAFRHISVEFLALIPWADVAKVHTQCL